MATPTSSCGSIGCNTEVIDIPSLLDVQEYQVWTKIGYIYLANVILQQTRYELFEIKNLFCQISAV